MAPASSFTMSTPNPHSPASGRFALHTTVIPTRPPFLMPTWSGASSLLITGSSRSFLASSYGRCQARAMNSVVNPPSTAATIGVSSLPFTGLLRYLLVVTLIGALAWAYQAIQPPAPLICGSTGGPPVTAPRVQLKDGRHIAYKEHGVPRDVAKYKMVFIHGFDSCMHDAIPMSEGLAEELGIYLVSFDRPGYGESDPNPKRNESSVALDVEELADLLGLGSKFYVIGFSMGGQAVWPVLKHIPHRLAGATLIAPVVNYWWPGFPSNLSREAYIWQMLPDQFAVGVAHYLPWLTYWWNTQNWFPSSSVAAESPKTYSRTDKELRYLHLAREATQGYVRQQGEFESLHRDMNIGFGSWSFDPMDINNPFANSEGSIHLWHGDEDAMVPVLLQRYIAKRLPWIQYHELEGIGHMFPWAEGMADTIIKTLILGRRKQS